MNGQVYFGGSFKTCSSKKNPKLLPLEALHGLLYLDNFSQKVDENVNVSFSLNSRPPSDFSPSPTLNKLIERTNIAEDFLKSTTVSSFCEGSSVFGESLGLESDELKELEVIAGIKLTDNQSEESRRLIQILDFFRESNNDEITKSQLRKHFEENEVEILFEKYDKDNSGTIDFSEFSAYVKNKASKINLIDNLARSLQISVDDSSTTDNDSRLEKQEKRFDDLLGIILLPPLKLPNRGRFKLRREKNHDNKNTSTLRKRNRVVLSYSPFSYTNLKSIGRKSVKHYSKMSARAFIRQSLLKEHRSFFKRHEEIEKLKEKRSECNRNLDTLNASLKEDLQWVHQNCEKNIISFKSKQFCQKWGLNAMNSFMIRMLNRKLSVAFSLWRSNIELLKKKDLVEKYLKLRASHKLTSMLSSINLRKQKFAFNTWVLWVTQIQMRDLLRYTIKIQNRFRIMLARKKIQKEKELQAVIKLQRRAREMLKGLEIKRLIKEANKRLEIHSAKIIQKGWRFKLKLKKHKTDLHRVEKCVTIQKCFRGFLGRRKFTAHVVLFVCNSSATIIQALFKGFYCRKHLRRTLFERRMKLAQEEAAQIIQCIVRMFLAKKRIVLIHQMRTQKLLDEKSKVVQRAYRRKLARDKKRRIYDFIRRGIKNLKKGIAYNKQVQHENATKIQKCFRGQKDRDHYLRLKKIKEIRIRMLQRQYGIRWISFFHRMAKARLCVINNLYSLIRHIEIDDFAEVYTIVLFAKVRQVLMKTLIPKDKIATSNMSELDVDTPGSPQSSSARDDDESKDLVKSLQHHSQMGCADVSPTLEYDEKSLNDGASIEQSDLKPGETDILISETYANLLSGVFVENITNISLNFALDCLLEQLIYFVGKISNNFHTSLFSEAVQNVFEEVLEKSKLKAASKLASENVRHYLTSSATRCQKVIYMQHVAQIKTHDSAIIIQKVFRRYRAQIKYRHLLAMQADEEYKAKINATITLQSHFRQITARKELENRKQERQAATLIQCHYRKRLATIQTNELRQNRAEEKHEHNAATTIQAIIRDKQAKAIAGKLREQKKKESEAKHLAATRLQSLFRGRKTRKENARKELLMIGRKKLFITMSEKDLLNNSAIKLQCFYRTRQSMQAAKAEMRVKKKETERKMLEMRKLEEFHAIRIQKLYRGRKTRTKSLSPIFEVGKKKSVAPSLNETTTSPKLNTAERSSSKETSLLTSENAAKLDGAKTVSKHMKKKLDKKESRKAENLNQEHPDAIPDSPVLAATVKPLAKALSPSGAQPETRSGKNKGSSTLKESKEKEPNMIGNGSWVECWDTNTRRNYYYNPVSKKSSWEVPEDFDNIIQPPLPERSAETGEQNIATGTHPRRGAISSQQEVKKASHKFQDYPNYQPANYSPPLHQMAPIYHPYHYNPYFHYENPGHQYHSHYVYGQPQPQPPANQYIPQSPGLIQQEHIVPESKVAGNEAEEWEEYYDDIYGLSYYYNTVTNETRWEKPEGFVSKYKDPSTEAPRYY